jgi:hypothetical protein
MRFANHDGRLMLVAQDPPRYLAPGDELASFVEGVGHMRHTFGARP